MGRNVKNTLFYSPLYCDFWDRHEMICIEEDEGIIGSHVALRIRTMIFSEEGYYMRWPDRFEYTIAKRIGNKVTGADVLRIFNVCLKHGLFDQERFDKYRVVTSADVQQTWLDVMKVCRRVIIVSSAFWLISSEGIGISSEEIPENDEESTRKQSKGINQLNEVGPLPATPPQNSVPDHQSNTGEEGERKKNAAPRAPVPKFIPPSFEEVKEYFLRQFNPQSPNSIRDHGFWVKDAIKFYNYYDERNWHWGKGRGRKISKWKNVAANWIISSKEESPMMSVSAQKIQAAQVDHHPATRREQPPANALPEIAREINYLFEVYREAPEKFSLPVITAAHYDHLKERGVTRQKAMLDKIDAIKLAAATEVSRLAIERTPEIEELYGKKFAVLEIFKLYHAAKETVIFFET